MSLPWGSVQCVAPRVAIVATGPSAEELTLALLEDAAEAGVHVIAVNGAIAWPPVAHSWFTLDPDRRNRPRMANPRSGTHYYAAVPDDYGSPTALHNRHRAPAERGVTWLRRFRGSVPLSCDPRAIRSGNSAFGALNLAWLMRAERVALIGVDGTPSRHAYERRRSIRSMSHLPSLFRSATSQLEDRNVEVRNGSPDSRVTCFPRCAPDEAIEWVARGALARCA